MILLAYRHGCRASEICNLRLDDVKRQAITIRRLKGSMYTVQPLYPHRGVPLVDELAALRSYLRDREAEPVRIPVRQPKGRQVTSQPILSLVPGDRGGRGLAAGQTTPARAGEAGARTSGDLKHDGLRRHVGSAGVRSHG
jgi:integrase